MTLETAPTEFVEAAGTRFAYRRLGLRDGTPLICLQHFSGTIDSWDPAVVNALAGGRPVFVFDNKGLGKSSGGTPDSVAQMAADAESFISALGFATVDLLGYSLGGMIAQILAAERPKVVRKVLLVGTAPQGGEEHLMQVLKEAQSHKEAPDPRLPLFFTSSAASQAAGLAFLKRASARTVDRDPDSGEAVMAQQAKALIGWCATKDPDNRILRSIEQPVLIVSGSNDTMLPDSNAYFMFKRPADPLPGRWPWSAVSISGALRQSHGSFLGGIVSCRKAWISRRELHQSRWAETAPLCSMNADVLTTRVTDRIAVITLGSARRIYFDEVGDALTEALDGFADDANIRVVVVTGGAPGYFIRHFSVAALVRLAESLRASGREWPESSGELVRGLEDSCASTFSIEIGNERTRVPVA